MLFETPLKIYWFIVIATREMFLFTFASCGANQSEACNFGWKLGESGIAVTFLHQTSKHIIFFLKFLCFNSYLYGRGVETLPHFSTRSRSVPARSHGLLIKRYQIRFTAAVAVVFVEECSKHFKAGLCACAQRASRIFASFTLNFLQRPSIPCGATPTPILVLGVIFADRLAADVPPTPRSTFLFL